MTDVTQASPQLPMSPHERTIDLGDVARMTLRTYRRTPWKFAALVLLPIPISLVANLPKFAMGEYRGAAAALTIVLVLFQYFVQYIGQVATVHGAERLLAGSNYTIGEALGVGIRRFPSLLGLGILTALAVLVGLVLLVVPGLIVAVMLVLGMPACVIESLGPIESMKRSAFLTKSNRWRIVGSFLLVVFVPLVAVLLIFGVLVALVAAIQSNVLIILAVIVGTIVFIPILIVISAMTVILLAVLFVDLRRLKEGVLPLQTVTQVFE